MIILHGALRNDGLFLWAEAPQGEEPGAEVAADAPADAAAAPYPHCAAFDRLASALRNLPVGFRPTRRRLKTAAVWLPTRAGTPHPSSALIAEAPNGEGELTLRPWLVEGLLLQPAEFYRVLTVYDDRVRALYGLVPGSDFSFWLTALRQAGALAARQRFLPDLVRQGNRWLACWSPVWLGRDAEARDRLAREMPAAARAATDEAAQTPPDTPARRRVEQFVAATLDQIVRGQGKPPSALAKAPPSKEGPVHDRWWRALRNVDPRVVAPAAELSALAEQIQQWRDPLDSAAEAPFRLCFRLEEPKGATELVPPPDMGRRGKKKKKKNEPPLRVKRGWYVRFLLQAQNDPNLLVPTADAWVTRGKKAAALSRMGADVHETLLAQMGQAAGVCPHIGETLRSRKPSGYSLDARGAYAFLTQDAPALEQAGFGVALPDWWVGGSTEQRLSVRARVDTPSLAAAGTPELDETLRFSWEICVGGDAVTKGELDALAKLKEPLQAVRGHWVEAGVEEIHAALGFWEKRKAGVLTARELVRLGLGSADMSAGIRFDGVVASGWMDTLLARLQDKGQISPIDVPEDFVGQLRPYQKLGYDWLDFLRAWGFGACLADDMGLGKTVQALALLQLEWESGEDRPVLVVCPTSVLANWEHEARRFTPALSCYVHHGPARPRGMEFVEHAGEHALVLTSYALLHRDVDDLRTVQWAGVILDEAQNVKNPETKQAAAVRALTADYRLALTGTPVENHVRDLWSIMDFLNPGFLGTEAEFKQAFFLPIHAHRDRTASERLRKMTAPFILRRLKTDRSIISDLPEKIETKVYCALTSEQGRLYEQVVDDAQDKLKKADGIERHGVILATLSKLKQVCNHPAHYLGDGSPLGRRSGKLTRLIEILEEVLASGERSVLFTQFAKMGTLLQRYLQQTLGQEVLYLHGGTPRAQRDTMVSRFQSDAGAPPVFVLSLKAGGLGLNLTAASHVFHFDRWWNPAVENQATDRAFRIGQTKRVQVHKFVCAGTLEERIDAMIEQKKSLAEDIVGTGENWITELNDDELQQMLSLEQRAVRD